MSLNRRDLDSAAIVLVFAVVGLAALIAAASTAPANSDGRAGFVDLTDRLVAYSANEIPERYQLHPLGAQPLVALESYPVGGTGTTGAPGPAPTDLPFGPNMPVWTDARAQTRPSTATDSTGRTYVAFQSEVTLTNRDIYISWSDDGGRTWSTPMGIAATGADEVNPSVIVSSGDRVTVFIQQDANPSQFIYIQSADRGSSWTAQPIGTGGLPVSTFQFPSFVANQTDVYGMYQIWCTDVSCAPGAWDIGILWNDDVSIAGSWFIFWFPQTPDVELFRPSTGFHPLTGRIVGAIEIEVDDNIDWAGTSFRFGPVDGFFRQDRLVFPPSTQFVWPSISVSGNRIVWGNSIFNATLLPYSVLVASYSTNGGTSYSFVSGGNGLIDTAAVDQKYVSFVLQGTQITTGYWKNGGTWYVTSMNGGAAFQAPARVSDNSPATAIDQPHAVSVANTSQGPIVTWHDSRDGNANIYVAGIQRNTITLTTSPVTNLDVRFGSGAFAPAPISQSFPAGQPVSIEARTPQVQGGLQYVFVQWSDGNAQNPRPITVTADATYQAQFRTQYNITVATNPVGRTVEVGGTPRVGPYAFWCDAGSTVPLVVQSPQTVSPTSRYRFQSWSDGGAQNHSIACDASKTVTANFVLQYLVTVRTAAPGNPALQVRVNLVDYPAPAQFWFDENQVVTLFAISPQSITADTRVAFTDWAGGPGVGVQTWAVTITSSTDYVANYRVQYRIIVDTSPANLRVIVEGLEQTAPVTVWWDADSLNAVMVNSPQFSGTKTQYLFQSWSDGDPSQSRNIVANQPKTVIAIFQTQYLLTMSASPGVGTLNPGTGWHNAGEPVTLQATPPPDLALERYRFDHWTGDVPLSDQGLPSPQITMDAPKDVTVNWFHQFRVEIVVSGPAAGMASVRIDGGADQSMPLTVWWNEGSSHSINATASVPVGADSRWTFASWAPGGPTNPITVGVSGAGSYTASYTRQFRITIATNPASGPVVLVGVGGTAYAGPIWADDQSQLVLDAQASQSPSAGTRYVFTAWADSATAGAKRTYVVTAAATLTAQYETQYRLTVTSAYGSPVCGGAKEQSGDQCWYTAGATATVTVTSPFQDASGSYVLTGWSGDASGTGTSASIVMDAPKTAEAAWRPVSFLEAYGLLLGLIIAILAIAIILAFLLMRRRKKQEPEAVPPPPAAPLKQAPPPQGGTKACGACGMEIPAGATTCPVCGAPA